MANNVVNLSTAIANKIQGVSGLVAVYAFEPDVPTNGGYPFATVTHKAFAGSFGDTMRNIRTYTFSLKVYQERTATGFGNSKAERLHREMVDEILTAFDMDTTFSGMVKFIRPVSGDLDYVDREMGDTRIAEFTIEATCVVDSI